MSSKVGSGPSSSTTETEGSAAPTVDPTLFNEDLRPTSPHQRTWTVKAYSTLWVAMCMNAATWTLAASLIALGMNWLQALMTIFLANLIVLVPMLLNSHAGAKHGISFPVFARSSFGVRGANLPAVLRGLVACGWFGIQTWFGGLALNLGLGALIGEGWKNLPVVDLGIIGTQPASTFACYLVCAAAQVAIIMRGFDSLRRFQSIAAPLVIAAVLVLIVVLLVKTGGDLGPVVTQPSKIGWGSDFWFKAFPPSLMANIAFWSTLSLNMPDFTRFAENQRAQRLGQAYGLPITMLVVTSMAILTTSLAAQYYGVDPSELWNPDQLVSRFGSSAAVAAGAFVIVVSTFAVNTAANLVSPALDFANTLPRLITFRRGAVLAVIIGTLFLPWRLLASPDVYILVWLGFYGGVLGAVGGVFAADYWLVRKTNLDVPDLFRRKGSYTYSGGWHLAAVAAFLLGAFVAVGGAYSVRNPDGTPTGPFPENGMVPPLSHLYDYNWGVAFLVAAVAYYLFVGGSRKVTYETVPFGDGASLGLPVEEPAAAQRSTSSQRRTSAQRSDVSTTKPANTESEVKQ